MFFLPSVISIVEVLLVVVPALLAVAFVTIAERKTMASMQRRLGPNSTGYFSLLQAFADVLKLLLKEYVSPTQANFVLFFLGPVITLMFSLLGYGIIPYGPGLGISYFNLGILSILAVSSLATYGIFRAFPVKTPIVFFILSILNKLYSRIKWCLNCPPKPHAFVTMPLRAGVAPGDNTLAITALFFGLAIYNILFVYTIDGSFFWTSAFVNESNQYALAILTDVRLEVLSDEALHDARRVLQYALRTLTNGYRSYMEHNNQIGGRIIRLRDENMLTDDFNLALNNITRAIALLDQHLGN